MLRYPATSIQLPTWIVAVVVAVVVVVVVVVFVVAHRPAARNLDVRPWVSDLRRANLGVISMCDHGSSILGFESESNLRV